MYKRKPQTLLKHWDFIIIDLIVLHVSFRLAYMCIYELESPYIYETYRNLSIISLLLDLAIMLFLDSLKNVLKRNKWQELKETLRHSFFVEISMIFYLFLIQERFSYSRKVVLITGGIYFVLSYFSRAAYKKMFRRKMQQIGKRSLLIVTTSAKVNTSVDNFLKNNFDLFHLAGIAIIDEDRVGERVFDIPVVANIDNVCEHTCREWVDEIFINVDMESSATENLIEKFIEMGIVVHIKMWESTSRHGNNRFVEYFGNYTVMTASVKAASPVELFMKRALDICGGIVGTIITGVLVLILGPMIYFQSPGPIFFAQERIGKNGKRFKMYKFRSMYMDAEERKKELMKENRVKDGMMFKLDFDPRIIGSKKYPDGRVKKGIGNYIRDLSLDEFPQFLNILKGDMSLVGTRPPTVDEWEKYELHHRARLSTKPGLTGMWQVSGRSNITDFEEVVKLDTQYISQWNFWLDIKILLKTVLVVLKKEGSM